MTKQEADYVSKVLKTVARALEEIVSAVAFSAQEMGKKEVDSFLILEIAQKATDQLKTLTDEFKKTYE